MNLKSCPKCNEVMTYDNLGDDDDRRIMCLVCPCGYHEVI